MQPHSQIPSVEEESVELALFREAWKAELKRKKASQDVPSRSDTDIPPPSTSAKASFTPGVTHRTSGHTSSATSPTPHIVLNPTHRIRGALEKYRQAIQHEQRSEFDEALELYRQAFRLHSNIDQLYHKEEMVSTMLSAKASIGAYVSDSKPTSDTKEVDALARTGDGNLALDVRTTDNGKGRISLSDIIALFPTGRSLSFVPENDGHPVLLNILPDEMIVHILSMLDTMSLERFAIVNRKARILTLDTTIWRMLVISAYRPPQTTSFAMIQTVIQEKHFDYRRIYIEVPRVRLDGVYIAVCHYVRPGLSDNQWVNVNHLITYHRYLRFFPSGEVLSLLTNEDHKPPSIIPLLKPTLRMKGLYIGNWALIGTTLYLTNLIEAASASIIPTSSGSFASGAVATSANARAEQTAPAQSFSGPHIRGQQHGCTHPVGANANVARYVFTMSLALRSRPLGRWNRLDIQTYETVNLSNGDSTPVALKSERPFWFSKVKSYDI